MVRPLRYSFKARFLLFIIALMKFSILFFSSPRFFPTGSLILNIVHRCLCKKFLGSAVFDEAHLNFVFPIGLQFPERLDHLMVLW